MVIKLQKILHMYMLYKCGWWFHNFINKGKIENGVLSIINNY